MSTSRPFRAGFDSTCIECGSDIYEGDMIVMEDGVAVHADCAEDDDSGELSHTFDL